MTYCATTRRSGNTFDCSETLPNSHQADAQRAICIVDLDNVCSREGQRGKGARACLDVVAFIAAVQAEGVKNGIVFQNRQIGGSGIKVWADGGFRCVATGTDVDDAVKLAAVNYTLKGLDRLILVASDGGYDEMIHAIRRAGVRVKLWALRTAVANYLVYAADAVRWIDDVYTSQR